MTRRGILAVISKSTIMAQQACTWLQLVKLSAPKGDASTAESANLAQAGSCFPATIRWLHLQIILSIQPNKPCFADFI
jgi:hypothetical protein